MTQAHIAIVDDDETLRAALGDLIRSMGYRITLFASADNFLRDADREDFAGVIADVQMPGSSGIDLARVLKADRHPLPVILITARPDAHYDDEAHAAGTVVLLRKPFAPAILLEHIEKGFR